MQALLFALVVMVASCVSASEIQPIGDGRYMISGVASGGSNAGKETTEATKAASAYCAKQSKRMVLQNVEKAGNAVKTEENVSLIFTCE